VISPFAGAIAAIEGYLLNPAVFDMPFGVHFQQWVTIAFIAGVLFHLRHQELPVGRERLLIVSFWLFLAYAALISLFAEVSTEIAFNKLYEVFKTVIVATFLVRAIRSTPQMRIFLLACVIGILHGSLLHILGERFGYIHPSNTLGVGVFPDNQRPVIVLFVPLLFVISAVGERKFDRILAFCTLPFALDSIVNTHERTGFVSLSVMVVLLLVLGGNKIRMRMAPVVAVALVLIVFRFTTTEYWSWVSTVAAPTQEASAMSRLEINRASMRMLIDHPLGIGYRNYAYFSHFYLDSKWLLDGARAAHNSFFSIACETGVPGFFFWGFAFVGAIYYLRKTRKGSPAGSPLAHYALALEIGLYGWLVGGWAQNDHEVDPAYWFVALSIILIRLHRQEIAAVAAGVVETVKSAPVILLPPSRRFQPAMPGRVATSMQRPGTAAVTTISTGRPRVDNAR